MATLKDHQQAMVDLLASGSGIPASASRLAHAMHDVLSVVMGSAVEDAMKQSRDFAERLANDATTPGLNDKALAADVEACRVKLTGAGGGPKATPAERRVKELENTCKQLRASNAKLRDDKEFLVDDCAKIRADYQMLQDKYLRRAEAEQAGCRKDDTQVCGHVPKSIPPGTDGFPDGFLFCERCGENLAKGFLDKEREAIKLGCELGGYLK